MISTDELQQKLDFIKKESKNEEKILEIMNISSKEDALKLLFESMSLIEVLWNQMIAFETIMIYKHQTKNQMFSKHSLCQIDDSFKSYDNFKTRTQSYTKFVEVLRRYTDPDATKGQNDVTRSISTFEPMSSNLLKIGKLDNLKISLSVLDNSKSTHTIEPMKLTPGIDIQKKVLKPIQKRSSSISQSINKVARPLEFNNKGLNEINLQLQDSLNMK
jgi:hypothetical protein